MGDMAEYWNDTKEIRKEASRKKKEINYNGSLKMLADNNIKFEDKGYHLVIKHNDIIADFWPTTGKWNIRKTPNYKRGVRMLIKVLRGDYSDNDFKSITGGFK